MNPRIALAGTIAALIWQAAPAPAVPGGQIDTLNMGYYLCQRSGDISGQAIVRMPQDDFQVRTASSYVAANGLRGTYLRTGDDVVMTSGPLEGRRFTRITAGTLRRLNEDGEPDVQHCVRSLHPPVDPDDVPACFPQIGETVRQQEPGDDDGHRRTRTASTDRQGRDPRTGPALFAGDRPQGCGTAG